MGALSRERLRAKFICALCFTLPGREVGLSKTCLPDYTGARLDKTLIYGSTGTTIFAEEPGCLFLRRAWLPIIISWYHLTQHRLNSPLEIISFKFSRPKLEPPRRCYFFPYLSKFPSRHTKSSVSPIMACTLIGDQIQVDIFPTSNRHSAPKFQLSSKRFSQAWNQRADPLIASSLLETLSRLRSKELGRVWVLGCAKPPVAPPRLAMESRTTTHALGVARW